MTEEVKNFIQLNLGILKSSLSEAGVIIGAMVDKKIQKKQNSYF